jgi:hypothetical protein
MRAAMAAFNRRDGEAFRAVFVEDAEIVPVRAAVDGTVYRGPDAGAQYCAAVEEILGNLRWETEELREGDDWLLCEELIEAAPGLVTILRQRVCGRRDGVGGVELAR